MLKRLKRIEDNVSLIQKKSQKAKGHEVAVDAAADLRAVVMKLAWVKVNGRKFALVEYRDKRGRIPTGDRIES